MKVSLIQIVDKLREFSEQHAQINDFGFGDVWEISTDVKNRVFPLFFVEHPGGSVTGSGGTVQDKIAGYNFNFYFMDLVNKDESNELDVLSDQLRIAFDLRAMINNLGEEEGWEFITTSGISWTTFTEAKPDELAGVQLTLTLNTLDLLDYCQVPEC